MARRKRKGPSLSSWFRQYYKDKPAALHAKTNDDVVSDWEAAHPGQPFTPRHRQAMANVKSTLKNPTGTGGKRKKRKEAVEPVRVGGRNASESALAKLELAIDHCLSSARDLDPEGLDKAIKHLRFARNEIVWKQGER